MAEPEVEINVTPDVTDIEVETVETAGAAGTEAAQVDTAKVATGSKDKAKEVLDKAFKERDDYKSENETLRAQVAKLQNNEVEAKAELLTAQGKTVEAMQVKLDSERERRKAAELRVTVYSRDNVIKTIINASGVEFKAPEARKQFESAMADQLKYDSKKEAWTTGQGESIEDLTKAALTSDQYGWMINKNRATGTGTLSSVPSVNGLNGAAGGAPGSVAGKSFKDVKRNDAQFVKWRESQPATTPDA